MAGIAAHAILALVLTSVLACQVRLLTAVMRGRWTATTGRPLRAVDVVWIALPAVAVLFLAGRSWLIALDPGAPAADIALVEGVPPATWPLPPM